MNRSCLTRDYDEAKFPLTDNKGVAWSVLVGEMI